MLPVKIPPQHLPYINGINYLAIEPSEDRSSSGVYILDVERMFDGIEPELHEIATSGAPVILYAGTEAVNWNRWQHNQPELHDFMQSIRGDRFFAVLSPAQGRLAVDTYPGAYWIHNHWEHETWKMCGHWINLPGPKRRFVNEYLFLSRRTTHDRMWLYYTIRNRGLDAMCSVGWRNYWGDDNTGPDYARWVEQRLHWYPEPEAALRWFDAQAEKNTMDCFEKLPDRYEREYCHSDAGDIYGAEGLFNVHQDTRVNIVADSAATRTHAHMIHTEKLWRSICAGQHTIAFGQVGYYHQLAEMGYPVNPPHWDLEDQIPIRLNRFMRSVESQAQLIDIPGAQQTLKSRVQQNPLPRELRRYGQAPSREAVQPPKAVYG